MTSQTDQASSAMMQYCGIRCEPQRLLELEGGRVMISADRSEIRRIHFGHGIQAQHPLRQSLVGLALLAMAYFPARHIIEWARHGGTLFSVEVWLLVFAGIGIYMLITALKSGYYLDVELSRGRKRFAFGPAATVQGADGFIRSLEQLYDLQVERSVGGAFRLD